MGMVGNRGNHVLLLGRKGWKRSDLDLKGELCWESRSETHRFQNLGKSINRGTTSLAFIELVDGFILDFLFSSNYMDYLYSKSPDMVPQLAILNVEANVRSPSHF